MKSKPHVKKSLAILAMTTLCFFTMAYVVADSYFSVSHVLFGSVPTHMSGYVGTPSALSVQVPTLVGSSFVDHDLPDPHLFAYRVTYVYHPTAPASMVIHQTPAGGAYRKVSPHDPCTVSLVVSMGREQTRLPDLTGLDPVEAQLALGKLGVWSMCVYQTIPATDAHQDNTIIATQPPSGTLLELGESVTLYVGQLTPKTPLPCPDLVGLSLGEAVLALHEAGLTLGEVTNDLTLDPWGIRYAPLEKASPSPIPRIISQSHPKGSLLPYGYPISVCFSTTNQSQ